MPFLSQRLCIPLEQKKYDLDFSNLYIQSTAVYSAQPSLCKYVTPSVYRILSKSFCNKLHYRVENDFEGAIWKLF